MLPMAVFVDPRVNPVASTTRSCARTTTELGALTELHRLCRDSRLYDVERWISVERWIFTAAHELGHLLLHSASFDRNEADEPAQEEKEADAFAGHFLMPQRLFSAEWEKTTGLVFLDRVLKLKRIFRVSYKTVLHRLVEIGETDGKIWQIFQGQHRDRYGKTLGKSDEPQALVTFRRAEEPDRLSNSDFLEDRFSGLVRSALENKIISIGRAAEILRLELDEMRQLAKRWAQ
jgi:Zn-dependent peptidase ImmA (M78 family)